MYYGAGHPCAAFHSVLPPPLRAVFRLTCVATCDKYRSCLEAELGGGCFLNLVKVDFPLTFTDQRKPDVIYIYFQKWTFLNRD